MKILIKGILGLCCFLSVGSLIRTQTDGFRMEKVISDSVKIRPQEEPAASFSILNTPFFYLDSGKQCYVFISQDGSAVLKVFKQYHFGLPSALLKKIPLPNPLCMIRNSWLEKRKTRLLSIYTSAALAASELKEETGVFYLDLEGTSPYPLLTVYDKIGIKRSLDLNQTPFLLQKKVDSFLPTLQKMIDASEIASAKMLIQSLVISIDTRLKKGIINSDPRICRNFGTFENRAVEIDIGSFSKNPYMKNPDLAKRELIYETLLLNKWLDTHSKELKNYLETLLTEGSLY